MRETERQREIGTERGREWESERERAGERDIQNPILSDSVLECSPWKMSSISSSCVLCHFIPSHPQKGLLLILPLYAMFCFTESHPVSCSVGIVYYFCCPQKLRAMSSVFGLLSRKSFGCFPSDRITTPLAPLLHLPPAYPGV